MTIHREPWDAPVEAGASTRLATSYRRAAGGRMVQTIGYQSKSDRFDAVYARWSEDNGRSWTVPLQVAGSATRGRTTVRNRVSYWLDPDVDRLLRFRQEVTLTDDEVPSGFLRKRFAYAVSADGGESFGAEAPWVEAGEEFDPDHPLRGVWYGRNSCWFMPPYKLSDRELLVPLQVLPLAGDGTLYNPMGSFTYTHLVFLHGRWNREATEIEWHSGDPVSIDPHLSSRGLFEPSVARLADGSTLASVCRGSNAGIEARPCRQWLILSTDEGWTWTAPRPLTFADGSELHHPSAMSKLFRHTGGRLYWFGNPLDSPARGNSPRYPLAVARFDEERLGPVRETVEIVDTRAEGESEALQLSNFQIYEDRETADMVLTLCRVFAGGPGEYEGPAVRYALLPGG